MTVNAFFSKWINYLNGSPYFVSFQVHCWVMCTLVYHTGKSFPRALWPLVAGLTALTAWKEFYWDHKNEPDHNAWPQGVTDFGSYSAGQLIALAFLHFGV